MPAKTKSAASPKDSATTLREWPKSRFIDRAGRARRIDFANFGKDPKIAVEVNGPTNHADGTILNELLDDQPPHSQTPVCALTLSGAASARLISQQTNQ